MRVGINGFGRIGRSIFRILHNNPNINIVAIKDYNSQSVSDDVYVSNLAYLLYHDTLYGYFPEKVTANNSNIIVGNTMIPINLSKNIDISFWSDCNVDIIIDSSGVVYTKNEYDNCIKLNNTVKKIIITKGYEYADFTYLFGVNDKDYDNKNHNIISASTCTGNAFVPVANIINDLFKIKNGFISTIHPTLSNEKTLDSTHKVFQLGKAYSNIKPISSRVVKSTIEVLPELEGKLHIDCISYRVPTESVSIIYGIIQVERDIDMDKLLKELNKSTIIKVGSGFNNLPLVSSEIESDEHSCIVDSNLLKNKEDIIRVHIWHDNEHGYCCRIKDILESIHDCIISR